MNEGEENNENHLNGEFLDNLEKYGLNYIKKNKSYLKFSIIFPLYSLTIIILNLIIISIGHRILFSHFLNDGFEFLILVHVITGLFVSLALFAFSFVQFLSLRNWSRLLEKYDKFIDKENKKGIVEEEVSVSLTDIFYEIIDHMEKIKFFFYLLNVFAFLYIFWYFRAIFFFISFSRKILNNNELGRIPVPQIVQIISMIILIIYLIILWTHFRKWNKKLRNIRNLEYKIAKELDLIEE